MLSQPGVEKQHPEPRTVVVVIVVDDYSIMGSLACFVIFCNNWSLSRPQPAIQDVNFSSSSSRSAKNTFWVVGSYVPFLVAGVLDI